jgi:ferric-dicitrate binding protein FerR (iron transport regulator)
MDRSRLAFLFHRYVNNSCTSAEKEEFFDLVSNARHDTTLTELIDRLWADAPEKEIDDARAHFILNQVLRSDENVVAIDRRVYPLWRKIAASLVLIILAGGAAFYYSATEQTAPGQITSDELHEALPQYIELPDGSSVVLNAGSKLDYPTAFSGDDRHVSLTGEAYFDIAHDASRPFVVQTGKLRTTVLGTAFNIKAYPDQTDITVTVTRGKVKVSDDKKVLGIINPDQQLTFNRNLNHMEHKMVDTHSVTAWMEKDIFFDDITTGQALDQLEKRFGINITLTNKTITDCRFTATFVSGEDIGQILRILCDFNNASLLENGSRDFIIEGGECPL